MLFGALMGADPRVRTRLPVRDGLAEALVGIARAAVVAPDREVTMRVGVRAAA